MSNGGDTDKAKSTTENANNSSPIRTANEVDEFGLPIRPRSRQVTVKEDDSDEDHDTFHDAEDEAVSTERTAELTNGDSKSQDTAERKTNGGVEHVSDSSSKTIADRDLVVTNQPVALDGPISSKPEKTENGQATEVQEKEGDVSQPKSPSSGDQGHTRLASTESASYPAIKREKRQSGNGPAVSEWSHQQLAPREEQSDDEEEVAWQAMPAIDEFDIFDDDGRLIAKGTKIDEDEIRSPYMNMAGGGKGYTRVLVDEDAQSATSMDEDTNYLFKKQPAEDEEEVDDDQRDALTQLETTKDLLTEGQRIAYVGVVRLTIYRMLRAMQDIETTKATKKELVKALESMEMWGQQIMVRLYKHMDIDSAEQLMIEQLAEHGLQAADLVPPLMLNAKVDNPMSDEKTDEKSSSNDASSSRTSLSQASTAADSALKQVKDGEEVPEVHGPEDMPHTKSIELDIRWTVLCDLFLVLLSEGIYDARSRRLLERVASALTISWIQICRFEKRVMDQLELQEAGQENWDESEHMEERRKKGLKKKYVYMGLATVGGGLVIGLSAGLLAPVIGAGLVAGFTTIGVGGTAGFLGGVGGAALITSVATAAGGTIAVRASHRRTGHVQTFEYRPLHNNKRLNLILSVSGWMTGKVDDVRQPFSTVDPIMGDIYSLLWEPEMLQSMGDTISILATEALTQTVQQVLGSTILVALMASLQLPVVLTKLAYLIDNPWTVSLDRANAAGLILADSLIARHLGQRPITLVGFSLGSRLIFSCLKELANRGAFGIVQNVYLFGSPIVAKKDEWLRARSVIAGRFVNGYASNDWILGYLFRATSGGIMRVAGLAAVENIPGLENLDVTEIVKGHMAYRAAMPKLLMKVGWEVESDEFSEIEDPDPENHQQRQRELIREIDEARRQAEVKPEKKLFGLFKRGKATEKKGWEIYDANAAKKSPVVGSSSNGSEDGNLNILFDIDAIRKELISEQIEVRELEGNQPPMQFTTVTNGEKHTEYLRLPPGIKPEEVAKMKLPPRPDEIEDGPLPPLMRAAVQRTTSLPPSRTPPRSNGVDLEFEQPRELKSTLPPLKLTSVSADSLGSNGISRPELKKHDTAPIGLGLDKTVIASPLSTFTSPELEGNAWADDHLGKDAIAEIKAQIPDTSIEWLPLDLTSLPSVKAAAEQVNRTTDRLDILILNAGIMATPPGRTESGQDIQLGTNHVGHFLLTKLLLPTLQKTAAMPNSDVRVVAVASEAHNLAPDFETIVSTEKLVKTSPWTRYGASKASNIMFAAEMARRYPNISSVSLHPGMILTDLYAPSKQSNWIMSKGLSVFAPIFFMDVPGGALNQLWAGAGAKKETLRNGGYYTPVGVSKTGNAWAKNQEYGRRLWEWTEKELAQAGY